jgi:hypothetical protein
MASEQVDISTLSIEQLQQVLKAGQEEFQLISTSFGNLKLVYNRFLQALETIEAIKPENKDANVRLSFAAYTTRARTIAPPISPSSVFACAPHVSPFILRSNACGVPPRAHVPSTFRCTRLQTAAAKSP